MRILFSALPAYGHVYPLVPLAIACRDAGHEVAFATGQPFTDRLPVDTIALSVTQRDFDLANAEVSAQLSRGGEYVHTVATMMASSIGGPMCGALAPVIDTFTPDLVITEYLNIGARVAALAAGVRAYSFAITAPSALNVAFAEYAAHSHRDRLPATTTWRDLYEPLIDPTHPALRRRDDPQVARLMIRPEAWSDGAPLPDWLGEPSSRPRVLVTLGTVFNQPDILAAMSHGLGSLDADVFWTTTPGCPPVVGLSPNIRQYELSPNLDVFMAVHVVIHNGSTNICNAALAAGLPQVILPQGLDHLANARALASAGSAVVVDGAIAPIGIYAAARHAIDPASGARAAADRLQKQWMGMPAPELVVQQLS